MLRDEIAQYTELSGNDGLHTPIGIIGAYLDGYEKGKADAEAEPKKGQWIPGKELSREMLAGQVVNIEYENYRCSACGIPIDRLLYHVDGSPFYKFCPNCGADMRGEEK